MVAAIVLEFCRETEPVGYIKIVRGDLLQELAHAIMEAEICHDMPSASWRTEKPVV